MSFSALQQDTLIGKRLEALWHPQMTGAVERKIETGLGSIDVTVGGREDRTAKVFWPSLIMRSSMWSARCEHYRPNHSRDPH